MTLVKFNKRPELSVNSIFNEFFNDAAPFWNASLRSGLNYPPVNIFETEQSLLIELNVPGCKKDHFKIHVDKGILTISYEAGDTPEKETEKVLRREFSCQSFQRSFTLNEEVNPELIQARYENGLLLLSLPKQVEEQAASKVIAVQ